MPFPPSERKALLALKGIGPTVITRLEQMGYESLTSLAKANSLDILAKGAQMTGSFWLKNSPQARAGIETAISFARTKV